MAGSRVLVDTNVLISAVLRGGKPKRLLELADSGEFVLVLSVHILTEVADVLARRRFGVSQDDTAALIEALSRLAEVVPVESALTTVCRDPGDEPVLAAAMVGKADFIVTGDADLLELENPPVTVLEVAEALEELRRRRIDEAARSAERLGKRVAGYNGTARIRADRERD